LINVFPFGKTSGVGDARTENSKRFPPDIPNILGAMLANLGQGPQLFLSDGAQVMGAVNERPHPETIVTTDGKRMMLLIVQPVGI